MESVEQRREPNDKYTEQVKDASKSRCGNQVVIGIATLYVRQTCGVASSLAAVPLLCHLAQRGDDK